MPTPLKNLYMPVVNVYDENIAKPAYEHKYIAFLIASAKHDERLFDLFREHVRVNVLIRRKDVDEYYVVEDDVEYEYKKITHTVLYNLCGIVDALFPNPTRDLLSSYVKYSGHDDVDEWIDSFCRDLPTSTASKISYLCVHHGYEQRRRKYKKSKVYLVTVVVEKIYRSHYQGVGE